MSELKIKSEMIWINKNTIFQKNGEEVQDVTVEILTKMIHDLLEQIQTIRQQEQESIFTGLNNLKIISIFVDVECDEYLGFTEAEVQKLMEDYDMEEKADKTIQNKVEQLIAGEAVKWYARGIDIIFQIIQTLYRWHTGEIGEEIAVSC